MAHGLPVISSDLPTSKEIMGDFAIYFPNGDIKALASKLQEATQIDWHTKFEEAIRMAHRFDLSEVMPQWQEVL
jgi:glycosyltransferase involved in cell wall biosynthesis